METYTCGSGYTHTEKENCKCALREMEERRTRISIDRARDLSDEERRQNDIRLAEGRLWLEQRGIIRKAAV